MTKAELRKIYLAKRKDLAAEDRSEKSARIAKNFFESFDLSPVRFLHCFIPIQKFNEIDTMPVFRRLWSDFPHVRTLVPRVNFETGNMEGIAFASGIELVQNEWGIREPEGGELLDEKIVDLVIIPGICFDKHFHRVGYGKGIYDRFLSRCRPDCVKIGVSFFEPENAIMDVHEGDVQVDFCITPERLYTRGG